MDKYKKNDKVKVKGIDWYNENKNNDGEVWTYDGCCFTKIMAELCGKWLTIDDFDDETYSVKENCFFWSPSFFDYYVPYDVVEKKIDIPDDYELYDEDNNVVLSKVTIRKKTRQYPQTLYECSNIMGIPDSKEYLSSVTARCYGLIYLIPFQELMICRDAYWKLYGEENGLGMSWQPDWYDDDTVKYVISKQGKYNTRGGLGCSPQNFVFPTEEMRDQFCKNFGDNLSTYFYYCC